MLLPFNKKEIAYVKEKGEPLLLPQTKQVEYNEMKSRYTFYPYFF